MNKSIASAIALTGAFVLGVLAISFGNAGNIAQSNNAASNHPEASPEPGAPPAAPFAQRPAFVDPSPIPLETDFTKEQEQDIREVVRAYLIDHPEVLIEALQVLQERQRIAEEQQAKDGAATNLAVLLDEANGYVTGADQENAKVAVIELFDYHCGYCKQASGLVRDLAKEDKDVIVAFREFPILRKESEFAAEAALAARNQGSYLDFHFAMMNANGVLSKDRILKMAEKQKLNTKQLEADTQSPEVGNAIRETMRIARDMGVNGTPAFVIASLDGDYVDVVTGFDPNAVMASVEAAKQ